MNSRARLRVVAPAIAVAVLLAALPATASAAPGWLSAESLTSGPVPTTNFSMGTATDMDDDGNSLAAWVGYVDGQTRVFASQPDAGGPWRAPRQVATAPAINTNSLALELADDGSAAVAWGTCSSAAATSPPPSSARTSRTRRSRTSSSPTRTPRPTSGCSSESSR